MQSSSDEVHTVGGGRSEKVVIPPGGRAVCRWQDARVALCDDRESLLRKHSTLDFVGGKNIMNRCEDGKAPDVISLDQCVRYSERRWKRPLLRKISNARVSYLDLSVSEEPLRVVKECPVANDIVLPEQEQ